MAVEELPSDLAAERVFLGLRLNEGIDAALLGAAGVVGEEAERRLAKLAPFVERDGGRLRLTTEGLLVSNPVLAELLR